MKMSKDEGYEQLKALMNFWAVREHILEDCDEWVDSFLPEHGRELYEQAMLWEKGLSKEDYREWMGTHGVHSCLESFSNSNDLDFASEVDPIAETILELVFKIIKPRVDVEIIRGKTTLTLNKIERTEWVFKCPSCSKVQVYSYEPFRSIQCRSCALTFDL